MGGGDDYEFKEIKENSHCVDSPTNCKDILEIIRGSTQTRSGRMLRIVVKCFR